MIRPLARHFFLRISYDGSKYRGVRWNPGVKTVETVLNKFLEAYIGKSNCRLRATSRTDRGVNAASNILYLKIIDPSWAINTDHFSYLLNYYLVQNRENIRALDLTEIPFYRSPMELIKERMYVYRLAILKEILVPLPKNTTVNNIRILTLPEQGLGNIFHEKSCATLGIDKLLESAEILSGTTNIYYCTTKKGHSNLQMKKKGNKSYIRDIQIEVKRGHPMILNLQPDLADKLELWEIHFKSHSYIYKQIRHMVGLMVGYAQDEYTLEFLKKIISGESLSDEELLTLRKPYATFSMPPQGLFLQDVELEKRVVEEVSLSNSYIELLANLTFLHFILHRNTSDDSKPVTLKDLPQKTLVQLNESSYNDLVLKGKDEKDFSLVNTGLGVVKVCIF